MMMPLYLLGALAISLCIAGLIEFQLHSRSLKSIPLRIHVNGTRGKSSVTRLVAAGLREGGLKTFAKTTGTAPRVIDPEGKDRIIHRLRLPSIGEQVRLLRYFATEKPDAVVMECMAVQPQYQWIAEHQMIKAHIGVITNVRPDHLEEMGPTEFLSGSHIQCPNSEKEQRQLGNWILNECRHSGKTLTTPAPTGSAVIFDLRILHQMDQPHRTCWA